MRGLTGFSANMMYIGSIQLIEMSKAVVLFWTNPMVTAIMAWLFLKEKITTYDWAAISVAIAGVCVIQNPFMTSESADETSTFI